MANTQSGKVSWSTSDGWDVRATGAARSGRRAASEPPDPFWASLTGTKRWQIEQTLTATPKARRGDGTPAPLTVDVEGGTDDIYVVMTRYASGAIRFHMLMMKNVYALGAYNLNAQDFKLDIYYNNIETGVDVPYLPFGAVNGQLSCFGVLKCDNLSVNGDRARDGIYDFITGYTVLPANGRVYFPMVEPFGRGLAAKFDPNNDFPAANKYIFTELYDSTKTAASFIQNKNRYKIKGTYRSASGSESALNALNIPQGAVVVTANGVALVENTDYTVDYTLGPRVKIINEGILNSGAQVKVSLESNSLFNVQQKSLWGIS